MNIAIKNKKRKAFIVFLVLLLFLAFYTTSDDTSVTYLTSPVTLGNIEQKIVATGEVSAVQQVTAGSQATGQIRKLHVKLGQTVAEGDILAEIDDTTQKNDLNDKKALLQMQEASLLSKKIALRVAQQQYNRAVKLRKADATSRESLENLENTRAAAKAALEEASASVIQTQIAVNTAEANLGYTRITAPISGTVVAIPVEEGQTVNAIQSTPAIATVADLSRMVVKLQISEGDVTKMRTGMKATFSILSAPDETYETALQTVDPSPVSMNTPQDSVLSTSTGEKAIYYYGRLEVDNPDGKLRIGLTALSSIHIAEAHNVLIVPSIAVHENNDEKFVLVMNKKQQPIKRPVTIGISDNIHTEIISGLTAGESIVTSQMTQEEMKASIDRVNEM